MKTINTTASWYVASLSTLRYPRPGHLRYVYAVLKVDRRSLAKRRRWIDSGYGRSGLHIDPKVTAY